MFRSLGISCDERLEQAGLAFRLVGVPKVRKASVGPGTRWPAAVNFHVTYLSIVQFSWSPMLTFLACFDFSHGDRGVGKLVDHAKFRLEMTALYLSDSSATEENFSRSSFDFVNLWAQSCGSKVGDFSSAGEMSLQALGGPRSVLPKYIAWFDTRDAQSGILRPPDRVRVGCHFVACHSNVTHLVDGTFHTMGEFHQF